jgi:serine/threonine protein phosphatase PrpC
VALWRLAVGFLTDTGRHRPINEDAQAVYLPYRGEASRMVVDAFFAVADGMGGHAAGDVASRTAVQAAERAFSSDSVGPEPAPEVPARLESTFQAINRELIRLAGAHEQARGMGTTLTLAAISGQTLYAGHIGDSRCYRLRDGVLEQLTEDHSWVAEQVRSGLLSPDEAAQHPDRNVLTQCLGVDSELKVFLRSEAVLPGDRYLLCSDGLHGQIDDEMMRSVLMEEGDPQTAAGRLVELANSAGGPDNITAVLFYLLPPAPDDVKTVPVPTLAATVPSGPPTDGSPRVVSRRVLLIGLLVLLTLAAVAGWLHFGRGWRPAATSAPAREVRPSVGVPSQPAHPKP